MFNGLLHAHSGLRWVALLLILITLIISFTSKNKPFKPLEQKLALFTLISFHTQGLIGFYLYMTSGKVKFSDGFMSETIFRFYNVEHIFGMVVAITLITIGYSKSKKKEEPAEKRKQYKLWFSLGLLIVLATIPWPFREALGANWF